MTRYAESTTVAVEKSKAEIERTLERYGANRFMHGWDREKAVIAFELDGRQIRFFLPLPDRNDAEFTTSPTRHRRRSSDAALKTWEQACRQRWRALALVIKAKLEAVETGITTFEEEFLAHIVLPDGKTVGAFMLPQVAHAYQTGRMPNLLPDLRGKS